MTRIVFIIVIIVIISVNVNAKGISSLYFFCGEETGERVCIINKASLGLVNVESSPGTVVNRTESSLRTVLRISQPKVSGWYLTLTFHVKENDAFIWWVVKDTGREMAFTIPVEEKHKTAPPWQKATRSHWGKIKGVGR